jgi:hypothetical protein
MNVTYDERTMWKEAVIIHFKVLPQDLSEETNENNENPQ